MVLGGGYTSITLSVINRPVSPVSRRTSSLIKLSFGRYERELNSGCRPPLRKIAAQDAPAAFPMVLCVSNIFWLPASVTDDGQHVEPYPELEVTDGWYRLRARGDLAMVKAIRKGVIRVGRKIGVAGARVCIPS